MTTQANYNNEIGLPLTLLRIGPEHQAAVVELAMRGSGRSKINSNNPTDGCCHHQCGTGASGDFRQSGEHSPG